MRRDHFLQAALEIGQNGENDTLPYDVDAKFIKDNAEALGNLCYNFYEQIDAMFQRATTNAKKKEAINYLNGLTIGLERLLAPTGSHGFRIVTKIHPFWNLYLNGLGLCIAETNEQRRSGRVHSYRLGDEYPNFFDRRRAWRAHKECVINDVTLETPGCVVVQADISGFYEYIYHHRLENCIRDLFCSESTIPIQIDRILSKLAAGRSFGLPVGGQCARILAEVMMCPIDTSLTDAGLSWYRYVDDFVLICDSQQSAYRALSILSHSLADYGLSLNRTKTTIIGANHYKDYVKAQLGAGDEASVALRELDLHFDPYSDTSQADFADLKNSFESIDISLLLDLEREKSQPDAFVIAQISRALRFQDQKIASQLCATLLDPRNLDSFRASWSKIMRGIYGVRARDEFAEIFEDIDELLDEIPEKASHLLLSEANALHYLRALRFSRTEKRGQFVRQMYDRTTSPTIKRACVECWHHWRDRGNFNRLRNLWPTLGADVQRRLWLAAGDFGDEGRHAKAQLTGC